MCPIIVIVWRQQDDLGHLNQTAPVREGDDSAIIRFVLESSFFLLGNLNGSESRLINICLISSRNN